VDCLDGNDRNLLEDVDVLMRYSSAALLVLVGLAAPSFGQKAELKWKFKKGEPFYQTMSTKTDQTIKVMGADIKQTQNQTFYYSWTLTSEPTAADLVFKQKIEGVKMDINIGGSKIEYDSTKETNPNNTLADFFKNLVGFEFTVTIDGKTYKVKKIEGKDEFIKKLSTSNPTMDNLLKQILNDDAMKEMADPTFAAVPNKEVTKGDKWTRQSKLDMGPIGSYTNDYTYTYDGPDAKDKNIQLIKVESKLTYTKPAATAAGAGLPFKITDANLKPTTASGTVKFNTEQGWVVSSDMSLKLTGDLSIEIGGQTTKVELSQDQNTSVATSKENPIAKKP
jgi:hypothetical protein